ncbi:Tad domain-containing protein [bacterium]|nr:Tad domain-containing protein [bacterium]
MKGENKYLDKGQVLVFFLVFIALCGLVMITIGIDIFRISQTKIMLQTAVDGRALHLISLYAKQMNFLADMNRHMIEPADKTYPNRCNYDDFKRLRGGLYSGGKWITASKFRPYEEPDDGEWTYNYLYHTEGHGGTPHEHCCDHIDFEYLNPKYISVSTPNVWDRPPEINKFDVDRADSSEYDRPFPSKNRMEEYRDDFIQPRADLQDKVIKKVRKLIRKLAREKLEFGTGDDSRIKTTITSDADFDTYYSSAHWNTHRKSVGLPYIVWEYHSSSWTHTYTSGTMPGMICTVEKHWWEVYKTARGTDPKELIGGWLYFDDGVEVGDEIPGGLKVEAKRDVTGLNFGTTGRKKNLPAEASVEIDSTTGELWPNPESSYKVKFK